MQKVPLHQFADGDDSPVLAEPRAVAHQIEPPLDIADEDQNVRPPVAGRHRPGRKADERPANERLIDITAHISPMFLAHPALEQKPEHQYGGERRCGGGKVDQRHHPETRQRPCQADRSGDVDPWTPGGVPRKLLQRRHQVDRAVDGEEEHGGNGGDRIQIAEEDSTQRDAEGDEEAKGRLASLSVGQLRYKFRREEVHHQGLQAARRGEHRPDGRGEDCPPQTRKDQPGAENGDLGPDQRVGAQRLRIASEMEKKWDDKINGKGRQRCQNRPLGDRFARVFQVTRETHSRHDAGDGREEDRKDQPEGNSLGAGSHRRSFQCRGFRHRVAHQHPDSQGEDGYPDHHHDGNLGAQRHAGPAKGESADDQNDHDGCGLNRDAGPDNP